MCSRLRQHRRYLQARFSDCLQPQSTARLKKNKQFWVTFYTVPLPWQKGYIRGILNWYHCLFFNTEQKLLLEQPLRKANWLSCLGRKGEGMSSPMERLSFSITSFPRWRRFSRCTVAGRKTCMQETGSSQRPRAPGLSITKKQAPKYWLNIY